jgi:hypothetical protein
MDTVCPACKQLFASSKSVSGHLRHCNAYKTLPQDVLRKRRENFDRAETSRKQRVRAAAEAELCHQPDPLPDIPLEPMEPMEVDQPEVRIWHESYC